MSDLARIPSLLWKKSNDWLLGIDTITVPERDKTAAGAAITAFDDSYAYSSPDYADLRRVIRRLALKPADVVYDFGCGLGRFVCLAARQRVAKVVGIEINSALLDRCRRNVRSLRGRKSAIDLRGEDASVTDLGGGTVFFLFNPFGPSTFQAVLANLERSLKTNPRGFRLVYFNPQAGHKGLLQKQGFLILETTLHSLHGLEVLFFRNA